MNRKQLEHIIRASAKDHDFAAGALRHGLVTRDELLRRLDGLDVDDATRSRINERILRDAGDP